MKPLIGITAGEIKNKLYPWGPIVYGQCHTYVDAVIRAGGVPVILPITDDFSVLRALSDKLDALLLSGGNDINPTLYGEDPYETTIDMSDLRDRTEVFLLQESLKRNKPILGICRGMQLLNVVCGGSLYQDIKHDIPEASNHRSSLEAEDYKSLSHGIKFKPESKISKALDAEFIKANSLHHQTVKELGKDLIAVGWSEDGLIEAIEMTNEQFVIGIQAHPEALENDVEPEWQKLFTAFIAATEL
jgi:putative glutamine amidotransferase